VAGPLLSRQQHSRHVGRLAAKVRWRKGTYETNYCASSLIGDSCDRKLSEFAAREWSMQHGRQDCETSIYE
jgi:hypothetical protein